MARWRTTVTSVGSLAANDENAYTCAKAVFLRCREGLWVCTEPLLRLLHARNVQATDTADGSVGDWIVGTCSARHGRAAHIAYAMRVTEAMSFNDYWQDPRFRLKRPDMHSSIRSAFGDSIYHRNDVTGKWNQVDSHHSYQHGTPNAKNICHDTSVDRVLVSDDFVYWGRSGPRIPVSFRDEICKGGQGHRCRFPADLVSRCIAWLRGLNETGYRGDPLDWDR